MVKIVGKSLEEKTEKAQRERFIEIAKRELGAKDKEIHLGVTDTFSVFDPSNGIYIAPSINFIIVSTPFRYDQALKLAKAYEKEKGKEFTLKKDYE